MSVRQENPMGGAKITRDKGDVCVLTRLRNFGVRFGVLAESCGHFFSEMDGIGAIS